MVVVKFEFAKEGVKKKPNSETGHIHNHNFYTSGSYLDYITREKAVYIQEDWKTKQDLKKRMRTTRTIRKRLKKLFNK
ncbi:hypothetical protein [Mycoplasma capricolum]|uniref:hypothetical protein n=1 Tax=Mycoplasma capricolum TaxID=2095 RepID=UPI0002F40BCE|nr:hypothetical protein [Mycoplasma capricolum]